MHDNDDRMTPSSKDILQYRTKKLKKKKNTKLLNKYITWNIKNHLDNIFRVLIKYISQMPICWDKWRQLQNNDEIKTANSSVHYRDASFANQTIRNLTRTMLSKQKASFPAISRRRDVPRPRLLMRPFFIRVCSLASEGSAVPINNP